MRVNAKEVSLAYTYAWWLTGSADAARDAVSAALARPDVPGADAELRRDILLRRVRAAAISTPTMCPASELALLHDALGVALDSAAGLARIHPLDAQTELAHGRLEALDADAEAAVTVVEPHRLGGLAVGNPADVAAARQNPALAALREMILEGRSELLALSPVQPPTAVMALADPDVDDAATTGGVHVPLVVAPQRDDRAAESARPEGVEAPAQEGVAASAPEVAAPAPEGEVEEEAPARLGLDTAEIPTPPSVPAEDAPAIAAEAEVADVEEPLDEAELPEIVDNRAAERIAPAEEPSPPVEPPAATDESAAAFAPGWIDEEDPDLRERVEDAVAAHVEPAAPPPEEEQLEREEVDLSHAVSREPVPLGTPGESHARGWILVGVLAVLVAATLLFTSLESEPASDPSPPPTAAGSDAAAANAATPDDTGSAQDAGTPEPAQDAEVPDAPLTVTAVAVTVGLDGRPDPDNPLAGPFEPISVIVSYTGAEDGDTLRVSWTVEDQPFGEEQQVGLSPARTAQAFALPVPADGWPAGQHVLTLRGPTGALTLGEARFRVEPPATATPEPQ